MKTIMNHQLVNLLMLIAIVVLLTASIGCSKKSDYNTNPSPQVGGTQGANEVLISGSSFGPGTLTVAANTTVTWTNKDSYAHTVTSDATLFDSGSMDNAATYSFLFTTKGSYKYHCAYHPGMTGTINVQ
jgi:plastocyanin